MSERIDASFGCGITLAARFAHQITRGVDVDDSSVWVGRLQGMAVDGQHREVMNAGRRLTEESVEILYARLRDG